MNTAYIYALRDPRDGRVFYVGKTCNLTVRFADHCSGGRREKNPMRRRMILKLRDEGFKPMLHILEKCEGNIWQQREIFWIAEYRRRGYELCNSHIGGFGWPNGVKQNPLVVKQRADAIRGRRKPQEEIERIRQTNLRTWSNPELRQRHKAFAASGERLVKLHRAAKKWRMSLPPEERVRRARIASEAAKNSCGNKNWWKSLSQEERSARGKALSQSGTTIECKKKMAQSAKERWASLTSEQRSEYWKSIHPRGNARAL